METCNSCNLKNACNLKTTLDSVKANLYVALISWLKNEIDWYKAEKINLEKSINICDKIFVDK